MQAYGISEKWLELCSAHRDFFLDHVYHIAIRDQTMKHATFIKSCDSIALFEPQTGTPQGGPKATDVYNRGLQVALNQMLSKTIEVSRMLNGSHLFDLRQRILF